MSDLWDFPGEETLGVDMVRGVTLFAFQVETQDGRPIGRVDEARYDVGRSFIVVNTAHTLGRQRAVLPAGIIAHVDFHARTILLDRRRDEIAAAPALDGSIGVEAYFELLGAYFLGRDAGRSPQVVASA